MQMANFLIFRISKTKQYLICILLVLLVSALCYTFSPYIGYKVAAFALLMTVSIIATSFDILPVLVAAILSALIWDFFFIPPRFTFQVGSTEDVILLLMYFVIALINAVLTYKIRQIEKVSRQKEEKVNAVKLYNTLLNSLSHELRTPIATIIGATDNLQSGSENLSPHNKYELVSEISKAAFRLNRQVENLLSMSRLDSGFLQPKNDWCDISELLYDTVKKVEENNIEQKISISVNPLIPLFKLDKGMLEQILYNLVNNATQYTAANTRIIVSAADHTDVLEIIVEDNGKGFPEDEIKNVFDKFYRLKNSKTGGTGLGLSIVKGFTEAMGGSVQLMNIDTGGSKFIISIPAETSYLKNLKNE
jgi:two-component system, OmpR family, sensor histidine kinase KdpD